MSWFTRALDVITPWRRSGEVQRDLERKRRREEEEAARNAPAPSTPGLRVTNSQPTQRIRVENSAPQVQRPVNIFESLNKNLVLNKPNPTVPVRPNQNTEVAKPLKPGTVVQPTLKVRPTVNQARIKIGNRYADEIPDTPEQLVNRGLDQGKSWEQIARENKLDLDSVRKYSQATRPDYGIKVARPKQGFFNKIRDVFDANTEADRFRRFEGNQRSLAAGKPEDVKPLTLDKPGNIISRTPVVGHVAKMANTGYRQLGQIDNVIEGQILSNMYSKLTKQMIEAQKRGDRAAYYELKAKVDRLAGEIQKNNAEQEGLDEKFAKNDGGLFNAGTLYDKETAKSGSLKEGARDILLPTAVAMLDLYTLGKGSTVSQGIKTGGVRAGINSQKGNIAKMVAGNYGSGDLAARAEGATGWDPVKAGVTNAALGTAPDVLLPIAGRGFRNRILPRFLRGRGVSPAEVIEELDDTAISASAEAASQSMRPRRIPVRSNIPIDEILGEAADVPVRVGERPTGNIIREVTGDATSVTPSEAIRERVAQIRRAEADAANKATPDAAIEGVTPRTPDRPFTLNPETIASQQDQLIDEYATFLRDVGEGNGTQLVPDGEGGYFRTSNNVRFGDTAGKRMTKQMWRDEAERQLRAGKADPSIQKAFDEAADPEVQALFNQGEQPPVEAGRPIAVKDVKTIPVTDQTVVPTDLPETPGKVRVTEATAPSNAKSEVVAAQPPALPREVQEVLDNPKQFTKRQVAAARNQRKLARQMAKTQEDTADALRRIETASPAATSGEGFVQTGEFGRSANGGAYQKASRAAEMQQALEETSQMSPADVLQTARNNQREVGAFSRRDIRNIAALFESKRIPRGTPEWAEARAILKEDGTQWGQTGALRNYTMRRTATASELISRYESKIYRLADDPSKIQSKMFDEVEAAEEVYTQARDEALRAYNAFTESPTSANARAYHAAQDAAEKADKAAKITEYKIASKILKGNKDIKQARVLEKMASDADLYQMDAIDASMLSGTGTFVRNFVNAAVGGTEEGLFGGLASRMARKITGQNVGGGVGKGTLSGFGDGVGNIVDASKARASNAGWNPLAHIKNWATTGNQLGDAVIDSQVRHNVLDEYTQLLKQQGFTGRELRDRASVMARQDPDNLARTYVGVARTAAGLGGGITRNNKIEGIIKNMISDGISMGKPNRFTEATAKLVTRMIFGFPTAIGRSLNEGIKRFSLGAPTFVKALRTADPQMRAILVKEGIKQAGTGGLVLPPLFYAMGANGLITGAYPKGDPEEQARWEREGITENSIKIGGSYYQLPSYLGAWAVPGLFYASLGRNDGDWSAAAADTAKIVPSLLPTDQMGNVQDVISGRTDFGKFMAQTGASAVRAATPGGAAVAEIAKIFDPTKNDTNSGTNWENFIDKVLTGIPGASNTVPDKVSDSGDVIKNPNPAAIIMGASSAVQTKGEQRSAQIESEVNSDIQELDALLNDPNLEGVLEDKDLETFNNLKAGKKISQDDLNSMREAFVKGVSAEGTDTAYLEREQYDTNLAVLRLKKKLMEEDKTVRPSSLKDVDTAIKRGEVYRDNKIPYEMISDYQHIGVEEWRRMGDPEDDDYDPEMYQKLWNIDQLMTEAGVSYRRGSMDKGKYYLREKKGSGRGGSGARSVDTSFGTLKEGTFTPRAQQYQGIDAQSGSIPIIRTVRPNIVHKITASR